MREHALPQDVTGYRFHIIGNMTLKQFAEVAAGVVVGFFIYQTNLYPVIKWPAILIAAGIGGFAAFVPFEERPFDHWITAFFSALYRPTQFYWKRSSKIPEPFLYKNDSATRQVVADVDLTPARRQRVKDYLHSVNDFSNQVDAFDQLDQQKVAAVMDFFTNPQYAQDLLKVGNTSSRQPKINLEFQPDLTDVDLSENPDLKLSVVSVSNTDIMGVPNITLAQDQLDQTESAAPATQPSAAKVVVPQTQAPVVDHSEEEAILSSSPALPNDPQSYLENSSMNGQFVAPTAQVLQNAQLPFPEKPTEPNKVVGMVLDQNSTPLPGVIVEILTADGFSARAVKTNLLGQFFINTPLKNGSYTVVVEKEGLEFAPKQLIVNGTILDPIEVRSTA